MPRPPCLGEAGAEQAPWSRVSGVAAAVTCPPGTSKTPAAPHSLLPTATSRSPPAATAARAQERPRSATSPGAEAPAAGAPRGTGFSISPTPPSARGWACREGRVPTGPRELHLGPRVFSGLPRGRGREAESSSLEKWGFGWREEWAIVRREGKAERDPAEFFGTGQVLTRVEQARAGPAGRVCGIRAGAWEGTMGGGSERTKRSPWAGRAPGAALPASEAGDRQPSGFPGPVLSPSPTLTRLRGSAHPAPLGASNCRAVPQLAGDPEAASPRVCAPISKVAS